MDWMYDGIKIQKEDYLLGKKVDKKYDVSEDNDSMLPPQICPPDNTFSQVDMTKKILEDPLVNIKKREIECTKQILQNPMRLKKQQNTKPEKHTIEDRQLDMILVSRLKSYEKAGLDLAKILSITKHKEKKEYKTKKKDILSSEEDEKKNYHNKPTNKNNKHAQELNNFEKEDKNQKYKKSLKYNDDKHIENRRRGEQHSSVLTSDDKRQTNSKQKYKDNRVRIKHRSVSNDNDNDNIQHSYKKKKIYRRSISEEKYQNNKNSNHKKEEGKNRERKPSENKRYMSVSSDGEPERNLTNNTFKHRKYDLKNNEQYHRSNNFDKEQKSKDLNNQHGYCTNSRNRRSRSCSLQKGKRYQKPKKIKNNMLRHKSVSSSSSEDERKNNTSVKQMTSRGQHSPEFKLDDEKHMQHKNDYKSQKDYGLFVPKGHSINKPYLSPKSVKIKTVPANIRPISPPLKKKKLSEEEMERMRKKMMEDAKVRDKERSSNVKRYRKEDKKEEEKQKPYSKEFLIKQLAQAASQVTVERSIKSSVNKLQKNNSIAD